METTTEHTPDPVAILTEAFATIGVVVDQEQVSEALTQLIGSPRRHERWFLVRAVRLQGTGSRDVLNVRQEWTPEWTP